jgi:hypothetical protein
LRCNSPSAGAVFVCGIFIFAAVFLAVIAVFLFFIFLVLLALVVDNFIL